jgi:hypothetical protein
MSGFTGSEEATESVAFLIPLAVGVKVTPTEQTDKAGRTAPQLPGATAKSEALAPPMEIPVMFSGASPVLDRTTVDRTTVCAALVVALTCTPNVNGTGIRAATGAIPVPLSVTVWVGVGALSVTTRVAVLAPRASGVNVTEIVQFALDASVVPHVVV